MITGEGIRGRSSLSKAKLKRELGR